MLQQNTTAWNFKNCRNLFLTAREVGKSNKIKTLEDLLSSQGLFLPKGHLITVSESIAEEAGSLPGVYP